MPLAALVVCQLQVLLRFRLVLLAILFESPVFIWENELVRQVILVEVVDEIPEALLVLLFRPEEV